MKAIIVVLLVVGLVSFLRVNLPSNDINNNIQVKSDNMVDRVMNNILLADSVADWQFIDYLVVKTACSENLKLKLIALPFKKWQKAEENIKSCDE